MLHSVPSNNSLSRITWHHRSAWHEKEKLRDRQYAIAYTCVNEEKPSGPIALNVREHGLM